MLDDVTARPLLEHGWARDHDALIWTGEHGTMLKLELSGDELRVVVSLDDEQVLGYAIRVAPARLAELISALAIATPELDALHHAAFSKAVAGIATEAVVQTTEGARIRPKLHNSELAWEPVDG